MMATPGFDLSFTPATNLQQLQRVKLADGESAELAFAEGRLGEARRHYEEGLEREGAGWALP